MQITPASDLVTVLSRARTDPHAQAHHLAAWIEASRAWPDEPGFVAGALLRSLDRERLIAYQQYTSQTTADAQTSARGTDPLDLETDSHTFRVVRLEAPPAAAPPPLVIAADAGVTTLINIFDTDPPRQQQLIDTWISVGEPFTHHPGFVAAALHRSIDAAQVVNYAHWRTPADWQDLVARHGSDFGRFRPLGQSDPHLYEVVHVIDAAVDTLAGR